MSEEQFEQFVRQAAKEYRVPPPTPKEEIWRQIQARRAQQATPLVVDLASRRRFPRWVGGLMAAAALLAIGVAVGRWSRLNQPTATLSATPDSARSERMVRFVAVNTFSQVEALLTDYEADRITDDFRASAKDLLSQTRLLLGSRALTDPRLKQLLEDLELMLVQVARLNRSGQGNERGYIDEGMAERAIRPRLRSAIPAGPTA